MTGRTGTRFSVDETRLLSDLKTVRSQLQRLSGADVGRAQAAALNKAAQRLQTLVVRGVSQSLALKQSLIRPRLTVKKASSKKLESVVTGKTAGIPLTALNPRAVGGGVQAGKYLVPDGFIATTAQKPVGAVSGKGWERKAPAAALVGKEQVFRRKGAKRYGLQRQTVNIRPTMQSTIKREADSLIRRELGQLLLHEYRWRIERKLGNT